MTTMTPDIDSRELIDRWKTGDAQAATALFERYVSDLLRVASRHISARLQSRVDEEDVMQTVFRTFFRRSQIEDDERAFQFTDDADIWKLLVTITLNKTRKVAARHTAGKRDTRRESSINEYSADFTQQMLRRPNHEDVVVFADQLEVLIATLKPQQADILQLRLQGYEHQEIARELDICERTVGRAMQAIRSRIEWIAEQDGSSPRNE